MIRSVLISLSLIALAVSPAISQNATPPSSITRISGSGDRVVASVDYEVTLFARRLGHVSAIARHADGTLYTADRDGGRIFRIQDRRMDGVADITQALPQRFDHPSGLIVAGDILFVADQGGLWRVRPGSGTPTLVAPFVNSGSIGDPHPITMISPTSMLLGLSRTDGTARLLVINTVSGRAELREETRGRIIGFSSTSETDAFPAPWILLRRNDTTLFGASLQSARNIAVEAQAVWIDAVSGHARVSGPDGVYATIATFAGLKDKGMPVLSGFGGDARPGAMVSDTRGLFVTDQAGGRLWRVSRKPVLKPDAVTPALDNVQPEAERPVDPAKDRSTRPELMRGSGISDASTIGRASTMPPASTLPKADQPRAASDPNE